MERAYREQVRGRRERAGRRGTVSLGRREQRRLVQLAVCIAVFLVVFIGKGVFPQRLDAVREQLVQVMGMDTDFRGAFSALGHAISEGEPVLDTLGELWVDVFGGGRVETVYEPTVSGTDLFQAERALAAQPLTAELILARRFGVESEPEPEPLPAQPTPVPQPTPEPQPSPTPEVEHVDYNGPALPANATMDKYALGLAETISPIQGATGWWVSSEYGWRDHPVDGEERFHNGVDLAVNLGTTVKAFADGVVDYIGESEVYGLYTQIRHDNGVTSFYAHCNRLCVQKGQRVTAGEKIAESGETGNATGPHLHFELRKDGVLLNPSYYLEGA